MWAANAGSAGAGQCGFECIFPYFMVFDDERKQTNQIPDLNAYYQISWYLMMKGSKQIKCHI
jgi:hypothetical protein